MSLKWCARVDLNRGYPQSEQFEKHGAKAALFLAWELQYWLLPCPFLSPIPILEIFTYFGWLSALEAVDKCCPEYSFRNCGSRRTPNMLYFPDDRSEF